MDKEIEKIIKVANPEVMQIKVAEEIKIEELEHNMFQRKIKNEHKTNRLNEPLKYI